MHTAAPEEVDVCVARVTAIGPTLHELIARYHARDLPHDPAVARQLQAAGAQIIPHVRFVDQIEATLTLPPLPGPRMDALARQG